MSCSWRDVTTMKCISISPKTQVTTINFKLAHFTCGEGICMAFMKTLLQLRVIEKLEIGCVDQKISFFGEETFTNYHVDLGEKNKIYDMTL